jgi:asparagine synthase (glutamine-hydrolysing)
MAHGVEVRMPFMDWRLVVLAMSLPDQMKAGGGYTKLVAREAMRGIMPEDIRTSKRKIGFNSQMPDWMNGSLGRWAAHVVARTSEPVFDETVDRAALAKQIETLTERRAWTWNSTNRLWPYINLKWRLDQLSRPTVAARLAE